MSENQVVRIYAHSLFRGGTELRAVMSNGETVIVKDSSAVLQFLTREINSQGFGLELAPRQEYRRLVLMQN